MIAELAGSLLTFRRLLLDDGLIHVRFLVDRRVLLHKVDALKKVRLVEKTVFWAFGPTKLSLVTP